MRGKFLFGMMRVFVPISTEDALNRCNHTRLEVYQIQQKESGIEFYCPCDQRSVLLHVFENAEILMTTGAVGFLIRLYHRPFHWFLLAWVILLYSVLSHTLFKIQFQATNDVLKQKIEAFLIQEEISCGQLIMDPLFEQTLKQKLKNEFLHELSWVEVTRHASLLMIRFNHKETAKFESLDTTPLISTKHAVVTRFEVPHGMKMVKLNQVVKPGDVLVQPHLIDSKGHSVSLYVSGQVYGLTWYTIVSELEKETMTVFDFLRLLYECRRQIETEIAEDEEVLKENILQLHESEGKIGITVHYTCIENITKQ